MKKSFSLIVFSLLLFTETIAQNNLPAVYEIKNDTVHQYDVVDSFLTVLFDKTGKLTIDDVLTPSISNQFRGITTINKKEKPVKTYWFQYRLKNTMTSEVKICFSSSSATDDYYVSAHGAKPLHYASGYLADPQKKDGLKVGNLIPIVIKAGDSIIVYQRSYNTWLVRPGIFFISVMPTEIAIKETYVDNVDSGRLAYEMTNIEEAFMVGLLLLSTFFNLFFFSVVKEREYLYFALFALFLAINRMWNILDIYFLLNHPALAIYVPHLSYAWAFISFFLVQFVRHFFHIKEKYRKWDRFLQIVAIATIIVNALDIYTVIISSKFSWFWVIAATIDFFIIPLSVFITLLLFIRKKNRAFRFFIIAAFPLMLFDIIGAPANEGVIIVSRKIMPAKILAFFEQLDTSYRPIEMICVFWLIIFFSWTLFLRYNELRKENTQKDLDKERLAKEKEIERSQLIEQQKIELEKTVEKRTAELKHSLENLQLTQAQLIQSEKMASLGELTAGIAHEIQNPLNFVNNFSEVNKELIEEIIQERNKAQGTRDEKLENEILNDIKANEEKINHHGKRADAIVKGMLQHSRSSSGVKEPTDINALADEYLRLAYHGLRAKDKGFNATLQTDYDETISKINITPQDIGRVLLNLYTNAFYTVQQKQKEASSQEMTSFEKMSSLYEPTISVSTKKLADKIEIRVRDNGNGIPQKAIDKIFQPFFTTKPTGQGTGLGLSLSYDIIKAHGGEIKVETKDGEGSEFIVQLPINKM